jgi:hypothetical protein
MEGLRQILRDLLRSLKGFRSLSHEEAKQRANQFLMQNLSPAQRQQYEKHGYFDVTGGDTGTHYRIWHGNQLNVEQIHQDGKRVRLCFMPRGGLPVGDIMLAQKLALELFESEATRVAKGSLTWDPIFEDELRLRRQRCR